jgi:16S rRNA (guanine527-N7)-methyltransferase
MLTQHTLDSLAMVRPLQRHTTGCPVRLLDVGSGAGLPGVVVAVCCPEIQVECVDAVAKKAAFIQQVAVELALPNLHARHARVEALTGSYEVITSRAFASLVDFVRLTRQALADGGVWMALKGKRPDAELAALPSDIEVFHVEQLFVPGLDAERCIVWLRRKPS